MRDLRRMPWGELVLMLQAKADQYKTSDEPKEASFAQIRAWMGC